MRALILGAGALGQVFGAALSRGGAEVRYWVRPGSARARLTSLRVRTLGGPLARRAVPAPDTDLGQALARGPELVLLALPSDGLSPALCARLLEGSGDATLVGLQPGLDDRAHLAAAGSRLLWGLPALVAWSAPEADGETTTCWQPPLSRLCFAGVRARREPLLACLRRGGLRVRGAEQLPEDAGCVAAWLEVLVAGLACASWQPEQLAASPLLAEVARAGREAVKLAARQAGCRPPLGLRLLGPAALRPLLLLAPRLAPFPLAAYFRRHYGKLGAQTGAQLATLLRLAAPGEAPALRRLHGLWSRLHTSPAPAPEDAVAPAVLSAPTSRDLAGRPLLAEDAARPWAVKRNLHSFRIGAPAPAFGRALHTVLRDPRRAFGGLRLRRAAARVGRPFAVGERFCGSLALPGLPGRVEEAFLSDYACLTALEEEGERLTLEYRYLEGCPFAGHSRYTLRPEGPEACRLDVEFRFQERSLLGVELLHRFGLAAHDRALAAQVRQAATLLRAPLLASTLRESRAGLYAPAAAG